MAYNKPGIEITQVQKSQTPVLIAPDLEAVVVGQSYWWQEMTKADDTYSSTSDTAVSLSGINADYRDVTGEDTLVMVDLQTLTGVRIPLENGTDFTIGTAAGTSTVTISSGIQNAEENVANASIFVAYRTANSYGEGFKNITSTTQVEQTFGTIKSWNVLAYAAHIALNNAGASVNSYGMPGSASVDFSSALDELATKEVYAIGIISQKESSNIVGSVSTHVATQSSSTNKKERIAFVSKPITFTGTAYAESATDKGTTAEGIRDANVAHQNQRLFSIHPEVAYIEESRHISTLSPTWITNSFSDSTGISIGTSPLLAVFSSDITLGTKEYYRGDYITAEAFSALKDNYTGEDLTLTVLAPVPGYYYTAAAVGQTVGKTPDQPLTNVPMTGFAKAKGTNDYFSEDNLNTIAEGGTYIIVETGPSTLVSRHQLSTDMSSVAKRELSIITALDFTAKFIRNAFIPYIGRRVIDAAFLKLTETVLVGIGFYLKRKDYIKDLKVVSIAQDNINPDTLLVEVEVLVKYPVNYIKIQLVF